MSAEKWESQCILTKEQQVLMKCVRYIIVNMVNFDFMCWRKLLMDTHSPVFCLLTILLHSTQRQRGLLKDRKPFLWGSDCCSGAENADDGRLCDWQLSAAHARAHCSLSRMTFRGWNGQTCDRKVKWVVRKRMTGQLGCSQPLRTTRTYLTHHSMSLKVIPSWRNLPANHRIIDRNALYLLYSGTLVNNQPIHLCTDSGSKFRSCCQRFWDVFCLTWFDKIKHFPQHFSITVNIDYTWAFGYLFTFLTPRLNYSV